MMWPRWSMKSHGSSNTAAHTPRKENHFPISFSFKDLRLLLEDDNENNDNNSLAPLPPWSRSKSNPHPVPAGNINNGNNNNYWVRRYASMFHVFHRTKMASSSLRSWKSFSAIGGGEKRIVVYYTSLRVVRKTFEECRTVRSIFRGFRVAMDERDVSMDSSVLGELKGILGKKQLSLPRVFIGGRYVGGAEEVQQLHESGELQKIVEGIPADAVGTCDACGGVRFVLCCNCNGSHKYYHKEKGAFRTCTDCNENGLLRCQNCFC